METLLRKIYYDISSPAGLGGVDKLYREAKKHDSRVTLTDVREFLKTSRVYTLHKLQNKKFQREHVVAGGPKKILSADLADLSHLMKANKGNRYLLVCVDVFSRYMSVVPIQRKNSKNMVQALSTILDKPLSRGYSRLFCDRGKEFYNKLVQNYLRKKHIVLYSVYSQETKASVCERAIQTLKHKIYRYLTAHNTLRYLEALTTLVTTYNRSPHKGLKGKTPLEIHMLTDPEEWRKQFRLMYKSPSKVKKRISSTLDIGDLVRVVSSNRSERFTTGYSYKNSEELFYIKNIRRSKLGLTTFELEDWSKEPIKGIFYREELIPVTEPDTFPVDILKRRKTQDGTVQFYVRWKSYPDKFNEWVNESDIEKIIDLPPS